MSLNSASTREHPSEAWKSLAQYLPSRSTDLDYWWQRIGPSAALVLEKAGYSIKSQYDALLFLYHWVVPELGPSLLSTDHKWKSLLQGDGSAFELSWKWNTNDSPPEVRYVVEPINQFSGTLLDPLNSQPSMVFRHRLASILPNIDLTWCHHFAGSLFDHNKARLLREMMPEGHKMPAGYTVPSTLVALEFLQDGQVATKSYFIPRKHGQGVWLPIAQFEESIAELDPVNEARAAVVDFVSKDPESLTPIMLAVDDKDVSSARIKWYFATARTELSWAKEIMTLGGRITTKHLPHLEQQLDDLIELIKAVTGIASEYPQDVELPFAPRFDPSKGAGNFVPLPIPIAGYQVHFNIAPGSEVPGVKLYIPMRRYARDDASVAKGITSFMESRGRNTYIKEYTEMLAGLLPDGKELSSVHCLQTYVSCLFKKNGELEITTYLGMAPYGDNHKPMSI
uniref:Prenyltransferase fsdK n=1 Tax=Fusarium heterosporum TaxID=42747 RepID=FSDK_FUSHE|nr:RecName: Full=Prenyltransferase fsdK; AltName: Full=Fusaridione A biosynthesis protein K [Fusarium heterosporum]AAV66102.1 putative dimethylallyltransferase [Fusarium heterosporum]